MARSTRYYLVVTMVSALLLAGCQSHPAYVCGKISATGSIKTTPGIDNTATPVRARSLPRSPRCAPKVAVIDVDGLLVNRNLSGLQSFGENPVSVFREKLDAAACDPCVAAVVIRINSPGGGVTATDIMRRDLTDFRQRTGLPTIACLMDVGAGGAYYLATACDSIYAHPTTVTGGLGVILNLYDLKDNQFDIATTHVRSGRMTDIGTPLRVMKEQERAVLKEAARSYHDRLRSAVEQARPSLVARLAEPLPPPNGDEDAPDADEDEYYGVENYKPDEFDGTVFDGRIFTASQAQALGLVDTLGYLDDAIAASAELGGAPGAKTVLFRRSNDRALTQYDITPNSPASIVSLNMPGLDRAQLPTFLYLWQPEPLYEKNGGP